MLKLSYYPINTISIKRNKQRTKLQKDYDGVTSRLSNSKFLEKASQVGA